MIKGDPNLPQNYDTRKEYPKCHTEVLKQSDCGSCWAFATSGMLSERFCIHSEG